MKPRQYPTTPEDLALCEAFISGDFNAMEAFFLARGIEPGLGSPVDLRSVPPTDWEPLTKVFPTPDMQRYLDSEDVLTDHTIQMMELALERFYHIATPWLLIAECTGTQANGDLAVAYFYIDRELAAKVR